jgi:predicted enzyme related to lactoylglutathione lyase
MTPSAIHLFRVILPVTDIERAAGFYTSLLGVPGERVSPGRHYFNCGGTILACYDPVADGDELEDGWKHHSNQYIYFAVPDLDGMHARAKSAGAGHLTEIDVMPWGERMFWARDPFGNPISFVDEKTVFKGN